MKKIILLIAAVLMICVPSCAFASNNTQKNQQLEQALNDFAHNDKDSDFDSASVKGKTITLKVADDFIEAPVKDSGRESFLHDLYHQVKKIQKQHHTKYRVVIHDDWTGTFAKMNYKGKGWYTGYGHEDKNPKNKCNFATLE